MRPTPIPDAEIWEGATRHVIAPPGGDLTNPDIAPVEALIGPDGIHGALTLSVRCILEDGELDQLAAGGTIWLTFWGRMVPWSATVVPPREPAAMEPDEDLVEAIEDALVDYDTEGTIFGTSGAGAYPLAAHLAASDVFSAGRCGIALSPIVAGGLIEHCRLLAKHDGWHKSDQGTEWAAIPDDNLRAQLDRARLANVAYLRERNTWARQLADMRDERDAALEAAEKARADAAETISERDELTALLVPDSPKMLRETLCWAQSRIAHSPVDDGRKRQHSERLGRLIEECDRHRPVGPDGKHGNRHTPTCGCDQ